MRRLLVPFAAALGALLLLSRKASAAIPPSPQRSTGRYSYGRPDGVSRDGLPLSRDPEKLLPAFADKLEILFQRLRAQGFHPVLHDGLRSQEQARLHAARGTGKVDSPHIYGFAADIIDANLAYDNPRLFEALGREAERLGLTWGGRFSKVDRPHVQAVPFREEAKLRAMSFAARDAFVRNFLS